ncbi:MAG: hypothetical protein ACTTJ6_08945 [Treponema sp.]
MQDDLFVEINDSYQNDINIELRYSRERRLEHASNSVKLLHSPNYITRQSFFSSIWSNKGHRFIFIAILILAFLNLALFFYYHGSGRGKIDGIKVEMETFQYNGDILVNVVFSESKASQKNIKAYAKGLSEDGQEIAFSETQAIYIGAKLILHFKMENKGIKKIETVLLVDEKVLSLSKRI